MQEKVVQVRKVTLKKISPTVGLICQWSGWPLLTTLSREYHKKIYIRWCSTAGWKKVLDKKPILTIFNFTFRGTPRKISQGWRGWNGGVEKMPEWHTKWSLLILTYLIAAFVEALSAFYDDEVLKFGVSHFKWTSVPEMVTFKIRIQDRDVVLKLH